MIGPWIVVFGKINVVSSGAKTVANTMPFQIPDNTAQPSLLLLRTKWFVMM